ncbi:MAG: hypothetical protein H6862_00850 [Rhodospirillales bacterium]|nr:hypothetical protein [Rhodospirillales bacterium]
MDKALKQICIRFCESVSDPDFQPAIPGPAPGSAAPSPPESGLPGP